MCAVFGSGARLTLGIGGKENHPRKPLKHLILKRLTPGKILVTHPVMNRLRYKILASDAAICRHLKFQAEELEHARAQLCPW